MKSIKQASLYPDFIYVAQRTSDLWFMCIGTLTLLISFHFFEMPKSSSFFFSLLGDSKRFINSHQRFITPGLSALYLKLKIGD